MHEQPVVQGAGHATAGRRWTGRCTGWRGGAAGRAGVDLQRQAAQGVGEQPDAGVQRGQAEGLVLAVKGRCVGVRARPARTSNQKGESHGRQGTPPITRDSVRLACIRSIRPIGITPPGQQGRGRAETGSRTGRVRLRPTGAGFPLPAGEDPAPQGGRGRDYLTTGYSLLPVLLRLLPGYRARPVRRPDQVCQVARGGSQCDTSHPGSNDPVPPAVQIPASSGLPRLQRHALVIADIPVEEQAFRVQHAQADRRDLHPRAPRSSPSRRPARAHRGDDRGAAGDAVIPARGPVAGVMHQRRSCGTGDSMPAPAPVHAHGVSRGGDTRRDLAAGPPAARAASSAAGPQNGPAATCAP